ncbi:MAG TPA: DegV family protein [Chloroflexi bacterium]|nr:DegV family protein [Chloroflexota bacterium]
MNDHQIQVVTDSTAYIPEEALNGLDIPTIPLWLIWGEERFRDRVDIDPDTFYRRLPGSDVFPTTSQPSAGEFERFFKEAGQGVDAILGIFISSKLSGTVANAQVAQGRISDCEVRVLDSFSTSAGLSFVVLAAARAAAEGKSLDDVIQVAQHVRDQTHLLFVVDTLEYLHRGGRIGGAKRLLGTALNIKPILHLEAGAIEPVEQVRTKRRAIGRLLDIVEERLDGKQMAEAAVLDVDASKEGDALAAQVRERFNVSPVYRTTVSPVIGAHVGPGTVGIAFHPEL